MKENNVKYWAERLGDGFDYAFGVESMSWFKNHMVHVRALKKKFDRVERDNLSDIEKLFNKALTMLVKSDDIGYEFAVMRTRLYPLGISNTVHEHVKDLEKALLREGLEFLRKVKSKPYWKCPI